jgi:hypothetical protein
MIQPIGLLPGFADHAFIPRQEVDLFLLQQVLAEELPEHLRPGDGRMVKVLDTPLTVAFPRPLMASMARITRLIWRRVAWEKLSSMGCKSVKMSTMGFCSS